MAEVYHIQRENIGEKKSGKVKFGFIAIRRTCISLSHVYSFMYDRY